MVSPFGFAPRSGNSEPMKSLKPLGTAAGRLLSLAFSSPVEGAMPRYLLASTSGAEPALILMNWDFWLKNHAPRQRARCRKSEGSCHEWLRKFCRTKLERIELLCLIWNAGGGSKAMCSWTSLQDAFMDQCVLDFGPEEELIKCIGTWAAYGRLPRTQSQIEFVLLLEVL